MKRRSVVWLNPVTHSPNDSALLPHKLHSSIYIRKKYTLLLVSACKWRGRCLSGQQREKSPSNQLVTSVSSLHLQLLQSTG